MVYKYFKEEKIIPIYVNVMNEQKSKTPKEYAIITETDSDQPFAFGDGKTLVRKKIWNIRIYTITNSKMDEVLLKYQKILNDNNLPYSMFGPTPDSSSDNFATMLTGEYIYG